MTKLYHAAEGWQVPGKQGKGASRVDVPNSPEELAAWLNDRGVSRFTAESAELIRATAGIEREEEQAPPAGDRDPTGNPNRCAECKALLIATPEGADKAAIGRTIDRITDWIQEVPDWAVTRLAENFAEIAAERKNMGRPH